MQEKTLLFFFGAIKFLASFHKIQPKQTQHVLASNGSSVNLLSHIWTKDEHPFGARCLAFVPKEKRGHKMEMVHVCIPCIWLGRNLDSNEHILCPISWDTDQRHMT